MVDQPEFVDVYSALPGGMSAMLQLEKAVRSSGLDPLLYELVKVRASQINGCAYCLDMHHKDARANGETEERLYMLPAWREATVYNASERAALALTEQVTSISQGHVSPEVEAEARSLFTDAEYAGLLFAIVAINAWNRLAITAHSPAGLYQPGDHG